MFRPYKIDKDAFHTSVAIGVVSAFLGGIIGICLDEVRAHRAASREKEKKDPPAPPATEG
jgi:hypothetical protein